MKNQTKTPRSLMPKKGTIAYAAATNAINKANAEAKRRRQVQSDLKSSDLLARINKVINK